MMTHISTTSTLFATLSIIAAIIGLFLVTRIWIKWNKLDAGVIKGRIFLNKKFLERNWLYVFLSGGALTLHHIIDLLMIKNIVPNIEFFGIISETVEFMTLGFLIVLAFEWYKILHLHK